jgi:predicted  nucleic acid-binding Zn-ribbon protein
MTIEPKFLETEAAMAALLDELEKMKAASEQLDQAGIVAQELAGTSQKVAEWTRQILDQSGRQNENTERVTREVSQRLESFNLSQGEITKGVHGIDQNLVELKDGLYQKLQAQQGYVAGLLEELKGELGEVKEKQETRFQEQSELISKMQDKILETLSGMGQRADKLAKMVNIVLAISILNAILGITFLVLRIIGR